MVRLGFACAVFLCALFAIGYSASAQVLSPFNGCSSFDVTDETDYNGIVLHTPMRITVCSDGVFMDYGLRSGSHSGRPFLSGTYDAAQNTLRGAVADYEDGTDCGPISYPVSGGVSSNGRWISVNGNRPIRYHARAPDACMITGSREQINRSFAIVDRLVIPRPPQPPLRFVPPPPVGTAPPPERTCDPINPGTVFGGVLGGFIGSQIGSGSGQDAATAAGAVLGALMGGQIGCR